jgi:branched-chain amino acid transport system substrate-binding protein
MGKKPENRVQAGSRMARLAIPLAVAALMQAAPHTAHAEDTVKIGLILPMTGPFQSTGRQIDAAVELYIQQHGKIVAGKQVEVILKDDGGVADATKRLAQELVVKDKVSIIAGFGLTPLAMAAAPIATQAKVPEIVMAAATSSITDASPFIVRSSQTIGQPSVVLAGWAAKNGIKKVVSLVSDYGPGIDAEKWFGSRFTENGGAIAESLRVPLQNPDFAPFLQRVQDDKPDALFVFLPSGVGSVFVKQFVERGLDKSGIRLIALGDVTDDDLLNGMGDAMLGVVTAGPYSAAHPSPLNKEFVEAFKQKNGGMRPNFMAVFGYDGTALIYKALEQTKGNADGAALVEAMKGAAFESPRGPISIDPKSREIVQDIYIRKVEKQSGELYNVEFSTIEAVHDPAKTP